MELSSDFRYVNNACSLVALDGSSALHSGLFLRLECPFLMDSSTRSGTRHLGLRSKHQTGQDRKQKTFTFAIRGLRRTVAVIFN
jgi:hypothetical protein